MTNGWIYINDRWLNLSRAEMVLLDGHNLVIFFSSSKFVALVTDAERELVQAIMEMLQVLQQIGEA